MSEEGDVTSAGSALCPGVGCVDRPQTGTRARRLVDLEKVSADRGFVGQRRNRALGHVAAGDVFGASGKEVCVGSSDDVIGFSGDRRVGAGRVTCYSDGKFFQNAPTVVPQAAHVDFIGAARGDRLGGSGSGRILIGDVTGDGREDLIMTAARADGPGEPRAESGAIFIIRGGSEVPSLVDLRFPPPSVVAATIRGRAPGDLLRVIAVGDVTGDGVGDLIAGAVGSDEAAEDAGAVYVFAGGPGLDAGVTIDLAVTPPFATVICPQAGTTLGSIALVAPVLGSEAQDLVIGYGRYAYADRRRAGAVFVLAGPMRPGVYDLTTTYDLRIVGKGKNDNVGSALATGRLHGRNAPLDLIVGAPQMRDGLGRQVGAVDLWKTPLVTDESRTLDMLAVAPATRVIGADVDDQTGAAVAVADHDGDGVDDLAITASLADGKENRRDGAGELMLLLGRENLPGTILLSDHDFALWVLGASARDFLGAHPNSLIFSDVNGDGFADVCVGSYHGGPVGSGRVDCFRGY